MCLYIYIYLYVYVYVYVLHACKCIGTTQRQGFVDTAVDVKPGAARIYEGAWGVIWSPQRTRKRGFETQELGT